MFWNIHFEWKHIARKKNHFATYDGFQHFNKKHKPKNKFENSILVITQKKLKKNLIR
jgi:hypothetical protein